MWLLFNTKQIPFVIIEQYKHNATGCKGNNRPSHTWLIILIRFITLKNNWMNPYVKTEEKCNESNEFKTMSKRESSNQIMRVSK